MKRSIELLVIFFIIVVIFSACSKEDNYQEGASGATNTNKTTINQEQNSNVNNDVENEQIDKTSSNGEIEDQLDLKIDDTGKFDTTLGTYEITLDSAKLVGEELDGERTQLDNLILIDLTIENTSDQVLLVEDLVGSLTVSNEMDETGFYNGAKDFASVDYLEGEIKPGEIRSGQLITDVYDDEKYYFREDSGTVTAGLTNQVAWLITADELKNE